ncbi:cell division ATP-binding protein FtsE [Brachybacterium nesterenkovii]|uniref:cell division ATP-binding protein FtsE n=1 Tax=Brachybacterium nesterenkovii TaxID=47847 RepID=UPI003219EE16
MIRFDDVTKTYQRGTRPALLNLDLEIERGDFVFLVGPSGSGKSTLMRLVLKETSPTSGRVYVAGKDLSRIPSWKVPVHRREIGMVFQDFRLLPSKTAYQNIEFALAVIGTPRRQVRRLVPEMLEMVGLADKGRRLPHELSGGEQQRVAIARAYVNRPSILLADEPTGNLDPGTAQGILELLAEINAQGTTVLMATHDQRAVDRMARRVIELADGRVVRDEARGTYIATGAIPVVESSASDSPAEAASATEGAAGITAELSTGAISKPSGDGLPSAPQDAIGTAETHADRPDDAEALDPAGAWARITASGSSAATPQDVEDETLLDVDSDPAGGFDAAFGMTYEEFLATQTADQPGADQSGADQPGADQSGADQPGADQPGVDQSGADQPGAGPSDVEHPDAAGSRAEAGAAELGDDAPAAAAPGAGRSALPDVPEERTR